MTIRVVVAATGKVLQKKALTSATPKCLGAKFWTFCGRVGYVAGDLRRAASERLTSPGGLLVGT
jgi:hypothetical protein